ncbi:MAG: FRG domain-containing protein [Desulfobacteraceae bacterium]
MQAKKVIRTVEEAIASVHFCGFEKGQLMFRGQVNADWDIVPSLFRELPDLHDASLYEAATIGPLFLQIKSPFVNSYDPIEQLMTAQHFNIPTRLTDWTNDILVGLFFACYDFENRYNDKNGRLTLAEKRFFEVFPVNSATQRMYKSPLDPTKIETYKARLQINDIYILEPLIKNPRMRVQDGCFMFFPFKLNSEDTRLLTLNKYIREQRKFVDKHNKESGTKLTYIFIASKEIDKAYKKSILKELDYKYGISKESLFIDSKYSTETEDHYLKLRKHADYKMRLLRNRAKLR